MNQKSKHFTTLILALLSFTFLLSIEAYAYDCTVTCQAQTDDVVESISSDDSLKIEDFRVNCTQYWKGSPSCSNSGHTTQCTCTVRSIQNSSGLGYGTDIADARAAARESCSRGFRSPSYVTYGSYTCN